MLTKKTLFNGHRKVEMRSIYVKIVFRVARSSCPEAIWFNKFLSRRRFPSSDNRTAAQSVLLLTVLVNLWSTNLTFYILKASLNNPFYSSQKAFPWWTCTSLQQTQSFFSERWTIIIESWQYPCFDNLAPVSFFSYYKHDIILTLNFNPAALWFYHDVH